MNSKSKAVLAIILYPTIVVGVISRILWKELKELRELRQEKHKEKSKDVL